MLNKENLDPEPSRPGSDKNGSFLELNLTRIGRTIGYLRSDNFKFIFKEQVRLRQKTDSEIFHLPAVSLSKYPHWLGLGQGARGLGLRPAAPVSWPSLLPLRVR